MTTADGFCGLVVGGVLMSVCVVRQKYVEENECQ